MRWLGMALGMAQRAVASGARVFELLDREPRLIAAPDAKPLPPGGGRVELRNVSFSYDGEEPVLRGIDLDVEPGRTVAIVGPTGSGKTTLVMLIPRLYDVNEGAVLVDGVGRARRRPRCAAPRGGRGVRRRVPVLGQPRREHRLRPPRRERGADRGRRRARRPGRAARGAAGGTGHDGRRARAHAQRRAAPARGDRPCADRRAAHPDPRRRHVERRRHHREPDQVALWAR